MNILIVTQYFWPENFRINDLVLGLIEREHQVTVFTGIPNYPDGTYFKGYGLFRQSRQNYFGAKVLRVPLIPRGKGGGLQLALNYLSFAICSSVLAPFLCRGKIDIIFVFEPSPITVGLPALVLKKLRSIPIMFWVQDLWPESLIATNAVRSPKIIDMVTRLVRLIYKGCDKILVTSRAYLDKIEKLGVSSDRLCYFPQTAEEIYQPVVIESNAPEHRLMPTGFRIMFAGNIGAAQDFATILDAAEILKGYHDIHWIIVGDGRMRRWVETEVLARGLSDTVHLIGRYPIESMPRFFSLADVMLVTLKKEPIFALTIPAKVQSYLACGKPIIAALEGEGGRLIAESKAGIPCPAEDSNALAEAVLKIYKMPKAQLENMGNQGRKYYLANFERKMLIDRLQLWMQELLQRGVS
ncbi:MAG TPA: glycosyltransferase family 4 protein [Candidatus Wunengus sp. YC65]|uniref:glycosyltransferase family 4 protein n=1 Tax=Candidatus Wunengus sp. YC65 TaxID=3367701 RepID=UPI004025AF22